MKLGEPSAASDAIGWIGENGRVSGAQGQGPAAPSERPAARAGPPPRWPAARIAAVEALWGDGFITPGAGPETLRLVKPLGLSSSVTLLLLGAGLGGPAKSISSSFGAWIASFEADPELSAISRARATAGEPNSRVTVESWDRGQPMFRQRSANHALSLEALRGADPAPVLESMAAALRPHGQIVLTELVSDDQPDDTDREFAAWCRLDNRLPCLPSSADVTAVLRRLHFDVRVVEDLSDRHISQTLGGWRDAVKAMEAGPRPTPPSAAAFVTEAELWLLRIRLMRRLGVRLVRWHAIGTA
jgi:hypothetical protein